MENYDKKSSELTKLEYALIHSNWEPEKDSIDTEFYKDRNRNPYNEPHKTPLRSRGEIIRDIKVAYFKLLLK